VLSGVWRMRSRSCHWTEYKRIYFTHLRFARPADDDLSSLHIQQAPDRYIPNNAARCQRLFLSRITVDRPGKGWG
jgi:hypothetical protein